MRVLIVIVNYRTAALVQDCLKVLEPQVRAFGDARVVLTDNLSPDDSVPVLTAAIAANGWGDWVDFRPLDRNGGFSYGNNQAIEPFFLSGEKPAYVWLLNPDTLVHEGALLELVAYLDAHPNVGIVGSRLEERDGTPQRSAFRFPTAAGEFEGGMRLGLLTSLLAGVVVAPPVVNECVPVDWVCGASMMVRHQVFDAIGFLDDGYFMYFEELDFCLRARKAGWPCVYVPASRVVHLVGQASGIGQKTAGIAKRLPTYWFDSRRRYFVKNHGIAYAALADLCFATGFAMWRVRRIIQGKPDLDPEGMLGDFIRNSVLLKRP